MINNNSIEWVDLQKLAQTNIPVADKFLLSTHQNSQWLGRIFHTKTAIYNGPQKMDHLMY